MRTDMDIADLATDQTVQAVTIAVLLARRSWLGRSLPPPLPFLGPWPALRYRSRLPPNSGGAVAGLREGGTEGTYSTPAVQHQSGSHTATRPTRARHRRS